MKRILSILSYILGGAVILLLVLVLAYRERITQYAVSYVADQIEFQTGYQVKCGHVKFAFPMSIQVECVKVFSNDQPQLFFDKLEVHITPWGALRRHIVIESVKVGTLSILASPDLSTQSNVAWEMFPGSLKINELLLERFHVAPEVMSALNLSQYASLVSQEVPMRISGRWSVDPFEKELVADFLLSEAAQPTNQTHIISSVSQLEDNLDVHVRVTEADHGILSDLLELPHGYTFQAIVHANAPISNWSNLINTNADLLGDFQTSYWTNTNTPTPYLGEYGFVKGPFALSNQKDITFENLEGIIGDILLQGTCKLTSDLKCDGTKLHFSMREPLEMGKAKIRNIHADCLFSGNIFSPHVAFQAKGGALDLEKTHLENVDAHGTLQCASDVLSGLISFQFLHEGSNCQGSSAFAFNTTRQLIGLSQFELKIGPSSIAGEVQIDIPQVLLIGNLEGSSELGVLKEVIGSKVEGDISWKAKLYTSDSKQALDLIVNLDKMQFDEVSAEGLNVSASILDPLALPSGLLSITCKKTLWKGREWENLIGETHLSSSSNPWPFSFSCTQNRMALKTQGSWHLEDEKIDTILNALSCSLDNHIFSLEDNVQILLRKGSLKISPFSFLLDEAKGYADIDLSTGYLQLFAHINDLPLDIFKLVYSDVPASGLLSGEISLRDSLEGFSGNVQLNVTNGKLLAESIAEMPSPWQTSLQAELLNNSLKCSGTVTGVTPQPIQLVAILPLSVSLSPFEFTFDKESDLSAHIIAQGHIEQLLEHISPVTTTKLTGETTLAIDIGGSYLSPTLSGFIHLTNGTLEFLSIGTFMKNVAAKFNIDGNLLTMAAFTAEGQESGTLVGSGTAELDPERGFPFEFNYQLDHLGMRPNHIYATVSGPLTLKGDVHGAVVEGSIASDSFHMTIPEKIPELAQIVKVKYINQPDHLPPPTRYEKKKSVWPLTYNVNLEIPRRGIIDGHDWASEWKGTAVLTGNSDHWEMHGSCKVVKGDYHFNGKSFEINQGTLTFDGELDKDTTLYVIANKDIEDKNVEIILKGDINHPAIAFRSNPPMPQREILSWILFNRGTSDISSFQGTQLNDSVTDLQLGNKQPDVLTQIRDSFGVDKIDICNEQNGTSREVSVQVGKYISKGVLVSVQKSITAEANRLSVEADLMKHVKVQAEIGDDADAHLNLKWKKDY